MADCGYDPFCWAGQKVSDTLSTGIWKQLEDWMAHGAATAVRLSVSGWISVPSPDVTTSNGGVAYLTAYTRVITYVIFTLALMAQAGQLAWSQRGEDLREMARGVVQFVVISGGGVAVVALLTEVGNGYADWILNASTSGATGNTMGERILTLLGITTAAGAVVTLPVEGTIVVLMCFLVSIAGLIQIIMIYARAIILVLLSGLLPVAAAAGLTRRGRPILDRYIAWGLAWLLYKPVAATIYAGAFFMMGTGGALSFIAGLGAIIMAVFALPALMRLINPMVSGVGGGGSGAAAAAGLAGPIADGAVKLAGAVGSSSTGDPTSGSGAVRDATHGSSPSGAAPTGGTPPGTGATPPGSEPPASAGKPGGDTPGSGAGQPPGAEPGGAAPSAVGAQEAGQAGIAAGAGAGAAAGPWGMAAAAGAGAAKKIATAPARGAQTVAQDATGAEGEQQ